MQFTASQHSRFFKEEYLKLYNAVYCLPSSTCFFKREKRKLFNAIPCLPSGTAVSLNGSSECSTMQYTACRPAQQFL
jgi:hypothetical protein